MKDKSNARDYAAQMRKPKETEAETVTALIAPDVSPGEVGLDLFQAGADDLLVWSPQSRRELASAGYTMTEQYLSLEPGQGVDAFLLGWSYALIPDIQDGTKFRVLRKMHLELRSGKRCSMLEAAQLASVFDAPMDGSANAVMYRGGKTIMKDGRSMNQWESWIKPSARPPTHAHGQAYPQFAGESKFKWQLTQLTAAQLARIDGAPTGLLEPYIEAAKERELAAAMAARDAAKAAQA